jgi:hypothetical protein
MYTHTHTHACMITDPRNSSRAPTPTPLPRHRVTGTLAADQVLSDANQQPGINGQDIFCFFDLHGLPHHFRYITCRLRHRTPNVETSALRHPNVGAATPNMLSTASRKRKAHGACLLALCRFCRRQRVDLGSGRRYQGGDTAEILSSSVQRAALVESSGFLRQPGAARWGSRGVAAVAAGMGEEP